mgnify:CR=1 FL=1
MNSSSSRTAKKQHILVIIAMILLITLPILIAYASIWFGSQVKPLKIIPVIADGRVRLTPIYSEIISGAESGVEIIVPSPEELGVAGGFITSLQISINSPSKRVELYSGGYRPSIFIPMRGYLGEAIREWVTSNVSSSRVVVEIPIITEIFVKKNNEVYYYISIENVKLSEISSLGPNQILRIKPSKFKLIETYKISDLETRSSLISETIIRSSSDLGTQGAGPFCDEYVRYEWRFNTSLLDIEKDLGGWVPVIAILNPYSTSASLYLDDFYITIRNYLYVSLVIGLGYSLGDVLDLTLTKFDVVKWLLKYSNRYISAPLVRVYIEPLKAYIQYIKASGKVNRYDLWYIKQEWRPGVGCVRTERWTGQIKIQTDIYSISFNSDGSAVTRYEIVNNDELENSLRDSLVNTSLIGPYALQPSAKLDLSSILNNYFKSQCASLSVDVGFPLGAIAAALLKTAPQVLRSVLALIPVSVSVAYEGEVSFDWRLLVSNAGSYPSGGNYSEYLYIYVISNSYGYDGCSVNLPILIIRSV